ncbi:MAG TPA: glycerol kinase GlpK [Gemmatimonadaceae bacterium]|jgi:glycerol kinase|nr:glycerol kinase GlpK [Gemmatimonadaceae bacterium]
MTYVLALDQGTTGSTALVIDESGRVVGRGYREITQYYPRPGWVEHDPAELLDRTVAAGREAIAAAGVAPASIRALGLTNQRETVVAWDPASPTTAPKAIVWQDRRTTPAISALTPHASRVAAATGLTLDPYFSGTKMAWLLGALDHRKVHIGTVDTWLLWNLTGGRVYATEPTNASRTMLFDIDRKEWSVEMCTLLGVPRELLAEVRPSSGIFGTTEASFFGAPIPIAGIAGDQQAALYGQGCHTPGTGKVTYGTGAFLLVNSGLSRPTVDPGLLVTIACDARGAACYAVEAAIFIAGAAIQWLRDGLGIIAAANETEALARSVASTDGVYFVPALTGLGAPHWEPRARGTIVGITRGTARAHFVRAALESIAYSTADVLGAMHAGLPALRVDGGAAMNNWLMQFQADVLDIPVERPDMVETTAAGAAGLAGLATGVWSSPDEFLASRTFTRFDPGPGRDAAKAGAAGWSTAVDTALYWARSYIEGHGETR